MKKLFIAIYLLALGSCTKLSTGWYPNTITIVDNDTTYATSGTGDGSRGLEPIASVVISKDTTLSVISSGISISTSGAGGYPSIPVSISVQIPHGGPLSGTGTYAAKFIPNTNCSGTIIENFSGVYTEWTIDSMNIQITEASGTNVAGTFTFIAFDATTLSKTFTGSIRCSQAVIQ